VKIKTPTPNEKTDVTKLTRIFRESPYRKPIPIETLEVFGVPYDPFTVVPGFLHEVRAALDATADHRFG
jgi:hypothetical protein